MELDFLKEVTELATAVLILAAVTIGFFKKSSTVANCDPLENLQLCNS